MLAIETARDMQLTNIWLESDSQLVVKACLKNEGVPWRMTNRWLNSMHFARQISFKCTHTPREGNMVADALAKNGMGLAPSSSQWWHSTPPFLQSLFDKDKLGLSFLRLAMT
jgi:ribonuclease HI